MNNIIHCAVPDDLCPVRIQIWRIMRLCFIFILAALMQVSAFTKAQKITLSEQNSSLAEVLKKIKSQSGIKILYADYLIAQAKKVSVKVTNASLTETLEKVFENQLLQYELKDDVLFITKKEASVVNDVLNLVQDLFRDISVRGVVTDSVGRPLPGATVKVKGSKTLVSTNEKGIFYIANVKEKAVLVISYLGYETREVTAAKDMGNIRLVLSTDKLQEVKINAGYYTVTDRERTGSISKVTSETISKQPVNNPLMALQGRVPGLEIIQQTGIPGGGFTVRVRGQNSLKSGNDPLYIIDGVVYPSTNISNNASDILGSNGANNLGFLSPNDIESIEILKDADATAIYGSRGANGIILITTKKGKSGNTSVNLGIVQGYGQIGHRADILNTEEYLSMRKEAFINDGLQPSAADYDVNGVWDQAKYTDWQEQLIGGTAGNTATSLSITGGNDNNTYAIGGNYYREGTVFPGDFSLRRVNLRSSLNINSSSGKFNATFTANYSNTKSNLIGQDLTAFIFIAPNAPDPYDQFGNLNWSNNTLIVNPMASLLKTNDSSTDNLIGNLSLSYKILKNLIFKSSLGYNSLKRKELYKLPLAARSPLEGATDRISRFHTSSNEIFLLEPQLSYNTNFGIGKFEALVGMSYQKTNFLIDRITARGYSSDELMGSFASASLLENDGTFSTEYKYAALFSRLNYSIANKYFINLTARRDGSSRFGLDRQYANFGAIGAAWIFSEEDLFSKLLPIFSFGKLRASYGIAGNDQISDYGYLSLWRSSPTYQATPTLSVGTISNPDFAWENNRKLEIALQLGFLKDKISFEGSFYRNRSSNQLLFKNLPLSTGPGFVYMNLPAEVQNKGWEFDSNIKLISNKSIRWSMGFNLTVPENKLLSYPGLSTSIDKDIYTIGKPLSIVKTYGVSVNSQTGFYEFEDKNQNGIKDDGDRYIVKFLGQKYFGGLQNSFSYKNFELNFLFSFTKQEGRSYMATSPFSPGFWSFGNANNQLTEVLNRWQMSGNQTTTQKYSTSFNSYQLNNSVAREGNISVVDASFVRLKNVSLSYNLPKKLLNGLKIRNASINIQGQNLFTVTNYVGLDPETQSLGALPPLRVLSMGLSLTF